jgi:hypothetical protein
MIFSSLIWHDTTSAVDTASLNTEKTLSDSYTGLLRDHKSRPLNSTNRDEHALVICTAACMPSHCNLLCCSTKRRARPIQTSSHSQDTCSHVTSQDDINETAHGAFSQNPYAYPVPEHTACLGNSAPSDLNVGTTNFILRRQSMKILNNLQNSYLSLLPGLFSAYTLLQRNKHEVTRKWKKLRNKELSTVRSLIYRNVTATGT